VPGEQDTSAGQGGEGHRHQQLSVGVLVQGGSQHFGPPVCICETDAQAED